MRTGNTTDGMYFFLLLIPIVLSLLISDHVGKKIVSHLILERNFSQKSSTFAGFSAELLIIITGIFVALLLVKLV